MKRKAIENRPYLFPPTNSLSLSLLLPSLLSFKNSKKQFLKLRLSQVPKCQIVESYTVSLAEPSFLISDGNSAYT